MCDAHVKTVVLIVQSAQDEIISNLVLPVLLMDEISLSWLSRAVVVDQDDPLWTSLELELFLVSSMGILVIFLFWGYFGHFMGFGGILVIFRF